MKNLTKFLCALSIVLTMSCAKEGAVGPAGINGNANVMYSDWINTDNPRDTTLTNGEKYKYQNVNEPKITQDVFDHGVILSYIKFHGYPNEIIAMPTINAISQKTYEGISTIGKFSLRYSVTATPTIVPLVSATNNQFRYVIIPSTTHLRLAKPLTQMTYDEVCELYNIPK